ncbi:hypothetical protein DENIS_3894 [Desulfonema ishimotonii]|uniref:KilA-N DNA-binding domain-containing protein n=2 Tax=Desulfonema ishimotonii TaxID=45657 RepID=A0A401G124_9BACT|nr:hypothetical protein DENIS_3894 [Desulfonema ishimotonii]
MNKELTVQEIRSEIINLPGRPPVMPDRDLAEIYETKTKQVNEAAKRNPDRFPDDFRFQLTKEDVETLEAVLKIPATQKRSAKIKAEGRFFADFAKDRPFRGLTFALRKDF